MLYLRACVIIFLFILFGVTFSKAQEKHLVDFKANYIEYNFKDDLLVATGDVQFQEQGETIKADKLIYNTKLDLLIAEGSVYYKNKSGTVSYTEKLQLYMDINSGISQNIRTMFADRSTFTSDYLEKKNASEYDSQGGCYTSCSVVNNLPTWSVKGSEVVYNQEKDLVTFYGAWFTIYDIPIFWTPYIRITNLKNEREMGFLIPKYKSTLGMQDQIILPFYLPIGDSQELFLTTYMPFDEKNMRVNNNKNPLFTSVYRGYILDGSVVVNAGYLDDSSYNANTLHQDKQWHYFMKGDHAINDIFFLSYNIEETNNYPYLNLYDINPKDSKELFLDNKIQLEGFFNYNSYLNMQWDNFRSVATNVQLQDNYNQDTAISYYFLGDYKDWGRINMNYNANSFYENSSTNIYRFVSDINYTYYQPTFTGNYTFDFTGRGAYYIENNDKGNMIQDNSYMVLATGLTWEYPLIYTLSDVTAFSMSPKVQSTFSNFINNNYNEWTLDALESDITANNLFNLNHYNGLDNFDDAKTIKYGLSTLYATHSNLWSKIFFGQSIKMYDYTSEDGQRTTIAEKSNFFINAELALFNGFSINYDQVLSPQLTNVRDSVNLSYSNSLFSLGGTHSSAKLDPKIFGIEKISEVTLNSRFNVNRNFNLSMLRAYDTTKGTYRLKALSFQANLQNECIVFSVYSNREYYETINEVKSYGFTVNLRNIGIVSQSLSGIESLFVP